MESDTELNTTAAVETACHHCGELMRDDVLTFEGKPFCCAGCKTVYEILSRNNLCQYYALDDAAGVRPPVHHAERYAFLDDADVSARLKNFSDSTTSMASFFIPKMHCSSCVWLLENLHRLDTGVIQSRVDFLKKRIGVRFDESKTSLRRIVELLASLGYEPQITLDSVEQKTDTDSGRSLYYKIGVAGFCFSNVMIFSFPEYLSSGDVNRALHGVFAYASLILSIPVFFYSATGYFASAWQGLRKRVINIDVPIALGIFILFARSLFEIVAQSGAGYLDSMTGLVFFLLVGKLFQNKTYDALNFERTYKAYFPLAVAVKKNTGETTVPVSGLRVGDRIIVRNSEIVPADSVLLKGRGAIDYAFVTGESRPVERLTGDILYAGGRQVGGLIELEVVKEVSQSYLTQLWNDAAFHRTLKTNLKSVSDAVSKYFTAGVLLLSFAAAVYWFPRDPGTAWNAITGILIVACPCALALAVPFAFGTAQRILGRNGFYLKNTGIIEALARIGTIVFDKTGTLTRASGSAVEFVGDGLGGEELEMIGALARNSHHPLSRAIFSSVNAGSGLEVGDFREIPNAGIEGTVKGRAIRLGSSSFANHEGTRSSGPMRPESRGEVGFASEEDRESPEETRVYVAIDRTVRGFFALSNRYRAGVGDLITRLRAMFDVKVLSGDSDRERKRLERLMGGSMHMRFNQSPADKLAFVASLQDRKQSVLMVGDGLNDAGALQAADVGVALTDDIAAFSPACDAILDGAQLTNIDNFIGFCKSSINVVLISFGISFLYNLAALTIAFEGKLSPVVAAILMPVSSITVVVIATTAVQLLAHRRRLL